MDKASINYQKGNEYFDTYKIIHCNKTIGYIEDHCRQVKSRYFIGWKLNLEKSTPNESVWKTEMFNNPKDVIHYSLDEYYSSIDPNSEYVFDKLVDISYVIDKILKH